MILPITGIAQRLATNEIDGKQANKNKLSGTLTNVIKQCIRTQSASLLLMRA
jgi:hypothetical protein